MKKITKKDRVENYLEDLMKTDGFSTEDLMNMTVYDLFGNAELEGIGKTTLSGSLNAFKQKHGLKKPGKGGLVPVKNTKKERVERYLTKLMKSPEFGVDDLMNLTVYDLFGNSELEGIGKTTLSSGISAFKKKYLKIQYSSEIVEEKKMKDKAADNILSDDEVEELTEMTDEIEEDELEEESMDLLDSEDNNDDGDDDPFEEEEEEEDESFEDVFINVIVKEDQKEKEQSVSKTQKKGKPSPKKKQQDDQLVAPASLSSLDREEIVTLKRMISRFKTGKMNIVSPENLELIEMKHALRFFGIDYKTILEHYRKNADK